MLPTRPRLTTRKLLQVFRCLSTKSIPKDEVKFTHTINLPKTKFPARLSAEKRLEVQDRLRKTSFSELYRWQRENLSIEQEFTLHDGPPYANGDLHMGHAVNKILKDLILKHKIASGTKVHYVPGWDCHGLPIELKALDAYHKKCTDKVKQLDPLKIRSLARTFAQETIGKQRTEFEQWGVTADWTEKRSWYRTLDSSYITAQLKLFAELFEKGLIYRDLKPVYWSPSSKSALAEAELEYDETHKSPSLYLLMNVNRVDGCSEIQTRLQSGEKIAAVIWTTTPWTLPANQAICFNPNLEYSLVEAEGMEELLLIGSELVSYVSAQASINLKKVLDISGMQLESARYDHPINGESLPFLAAAHVKAEKGTGLVHTAPAHGPDDFLIFLTHKIPIKSLIDESGCYNDLSPDFLKGKFALTDGNQLVLNRLQRVTLVCGSIEHSYPIDWRTKEPVLLRASEQWFINTDRLKESALEAVEEVSIFPRTSAEVSKKVLRGQLQKRAYWCISRQRSWGVPIPVVYDRRSMKPIVHSGIIENLIYKLEQTGGIDFWWTSKMHELVPQHVLTELNLSAEDLVKGSDILDIWFDSGISWLSVLGRNRTADLYLEGLDQFTGWFQSSLLTSVAARGQSPYRAIFVHGFAVDENGSKMSKSLGNIISPKEIVKQYGCDALRWWVAAHAIQNTSIPVSHKLLTASAENVQKIRGIMRYLLGVISTRGQVKSDASCLNHMDRYYLQQLQKLHDTIFTLYDSYQYNKASAIILTFCTSTLSGFYLHLIKDRLYCGLDEQYHSLQAILAQTFNILCKVLWPITPFLVEESWSYHKAEEPFYKSCHQLKPAIEFANCATTPAIVEQALDLKRHIFQQQHMEINAWLLTVDISLPKSSLLLLQKLHPTLNRPCSDSELTEILQVGAVCLRESSDDGMAIKIDKLDSQLCPRCRRFVLDTEHSSICQRCETVLKAKSL
ncbi:isoleucine--tRNA ligase, mitochondrial [Topomyia yanbarensis]|uniref:isoleucine--tRNA ligase, mitochondrial n=1 Tax=Topomyia yanbarensis TaxID=2498891 RepID=UPI00273AA3B4|nr:isoleucine--tRNA ligase, mitochondrial [Topomyia yanbarensis]